MNEKELTRIENRIGYNFKNKDLLHQAFIRSSYSKENGGEDNEVLEFIGDKALDLTVVKILTETFGYFVSECEDYDSDEDFDEFCCECSEGELTKIKQKLVNKKMLASQIDRLQLDEFLIMSDGDWNNKVNESDSVKEDLFEAIIGAVALDTNWNFDEIRNVVDIMLNPDIYINDDSECNYVELIQEWTLKKNNIIPLYHFKKAGWEISLYDGFNGITEPRVFPSSESHRISSCKYHCLLNLGNDLPNFRGFGSSKSEARKYVSKFAYKYLEEHDLLFTIKDEIENPNKNDAINQLEILARRGYFSIPQYDFQQKYDNDGNPIWICKCVIVEYDKVFSAKQSSKKDAKKESAYKMLKYILNK